MAADNSEPQVAGSYQVSSGPCETPQPTKSPRRIAAEETVEHELGVIRWLKRRRADVRRSKTSLVELLLGDTTRDLGKKLQTDLVNAERALTDQLNNAAERLRNAKLLLQVREGGAQ